MESAFTKPHMVLSNFVVEVFFVISNSFHTIYNHWQLCLLALKVFFDGHCKQKCKKPDKPW